MTTRVQCKRCPGQFIWVKTKATGVSMPLDPEPDPEGNVSINEDGLAEVHPGMLRDLVPPELRWMPHKKTCDEWRAAHPGVDPTAVPPIDSGNRGRARSTDPSTSHRGARDVSFRAGTQKWKLMVLAYGPADPEGLTPDEAAIITGLAEWPNCCWWKRCSELVQDGFLEVTDDERRSRGRSMERVLRITDKGRALVAKLNGAQ